MKVHCHCTPISEAVAANMAWVKAIAGQAQLEDHCFHCRVNICCCKGMLRWVLRSEDGTIDCSSNVGGALSNMGNTANEGFAWTVGGDESLLVNDLTAAIILLVRYAESDCCTVMK